MIPREVALVCALRLFIAQFHFAAHALRKALQLVARFFRQSPVGQIEAAPRVGTRTEFGHQFPLLCFFVERRAEVVVNILPKLRLGLLLVALAEIFYARLAALFRQRLAESHRESPHIRLQRFGLLRRAPLPEDKLRQRKAPVLLCGSRCARQIGKIVGEGLADFPYPRLRVEISRQLQGL